MRSCSVEPVNIETLLTDLQCPCHSAYYVIFVGIKKTRGTESPGSTTTSHQDFVSIVMTQEKLRCYFCNIMFLSVPELEYHYSHTQHRVNIVRRTRKLNAKSAKKFRQPPDGVYKGHYKLCRRFGTRDYLLLIHDFFPPVSLIK